MKKVILTILLFVFGLCLINCSSDSGDHTIKTERELRKGYSECKVWGYRYKFGELDKTNKTLITHYTYDKEGNILSELEECGGSEVKKRVFKYNKANMPIEIIRYDKDGGKYSHEFIKYHNGDTTIAESTSDRKSTKHQFKYDSKGNETYEFYSNKNG